MTAQAGGCLCGAVRVAATAPPQRVTICHCRFCQRATGTAYMVEPIFRREDFDVTQGSPAVYDLRSAGSGLMVHVHFCARCGTKIYLTFERWPDIRGVYAGIFDNPDWIEVRPESGKQIFCDEARPDTILQPHLPAFGQHAFDNDGTQRPGKIYDAPHIVGRRSGQ